MIRLPHRALFLTAALLSVVGMSGCGSSNNSKIVGTWTAPAVYENLLPTEWNLNGDGTFVLKIKGKDGAGKVYEIDLKGTYHDDPKAVYTKCKEIVIDKSVPDEVAKASRKSFEQTYKIGTEMKHTIVWADSNTIRTDAFESFGTQWKRG